MISMNKMLSIISLLLVATSLLLSPIESRNLNGVNQQPDPVAAASVNLAPIGSQQIQPADNSRQQLKFQSSSTPVIINYQASQPSMRSNQFQVQKPQQQQPQQQPAPNSNRYSNRLHQSSQLKPTTGYSAQESRHNQQPHQQQQQHFKPNGYYNGQQVFSHHQSVQRFSVCQIADSQWNGTRCRPNQEEGFKGTAMAEFQQLLHKTSLDLQHLLSSSFIEFRSLSLGSVLLAQKQTLQRLTDSQFNQFVNLQHYNHHTHTHHQHHSHQRTATFQRNQYLRNSTNRLFGAMLDHLERYDSLSSVANNEVESQASTIQRRSSQLNDELNGFIRRVNLLFIRQKLEQKSAGPISLDLDCLDKNLERSQQLEMIQNELWAGKSDSDLLSEQHELTQSIKQSLEIARTLLSSLNFAKSMFYNLTQHASEWMPQSSCREALARMTVCSQCAPENQQSQLRYQNPQSRAPCEPYCLNVVRGCMNDIYELNRFWTEHVNSLIKFKTNMIQTNNIENVMSNLDEKLITFMSKLSQQYNFTSNKLTSTSSSPSTSISIQGGELAVRVSKRARQR